MMRGLLVTSLLIAALLPIFAEDPKVAYGVVESCAGCRLNRMPEVKRFLQQSVGQGEYPNLSVKYIPGHPPELALYTAEGVQISREAIQHMTYDEMHAFVQSKGFAKKGEAATQQQEQEPEEKAEAAELKKQQEAGAAVV